MTFLNMIRRAGVWAFLLFVGAAGPVRAGIHDRLMWTDSAVAAPDRHVAFRGTFSLDADTTVDLQLSGASWYVVWLDGAYYTEGPDRYAAKYPEYQTRRVRLAAGEHALAVQVQHEGVATRILREIQPFLYVRASVGDREVPVRWLPSARGLRFAGPQGQSSAGLGRVGRYAPVAGRLAAGVFRRFVVGGACLRPSSARGVRSVADRARAQSRRDAPPDREGRSRRSVRLPGRQSRGEFLPARSGRQPLSGSGRLAALRFGARPALETLLADGLARGSGRRDRVFSAADGWPRGSRCRRATRTTCAVSWREAASRHFSRSCLRAAVSSRCM